MIRMRSLLSSLLLTSTFALSTSYLGLVAWDTLASLREPDVPSFPWAVDQGLDDEELAELRRLVAAAGGEIVWDSPACLRYQLARARGELPPLRLEPWTARPVADADVGIRDQLAWPAFTCSLSWTLSAPARLEDRSDAWLALEPLPPWSVAAVATGARLELTGLPSGWRDHDVAGALASATAGRARRAALAADAPRAPRAEAATPPRRRPLHRALRSRELRRRENARVRAPETARAGRGRAACASPRPSWFSCSSSRSRRR